MNDFGPLFDPPPPLADETSSEPGRAASETPAPETDRRREVAETWGVHELNERIQAALDDAFPREIWVRGEIQGFARGRRGRHQYFELVEKEEGQDAVLARIAVVLWGGDRWRLQQDLARAPGFELQDGIEVRLRCRVSLFPAWGKLQLRIVGVDPEFTLGQMAANRERILRRLQAEGLLERNGQISLPRVPQHVGLVTSVGSAAFNDFVREIERGGYAVRLTCVDARVQGIEAESTIVAALRTLARRRPDVVVLVRGGGSQSDLAAFDSEAIARAISAMPMPVFTGIGHEIDTSVADLVAHTRFKTPTACAAAIVERIADFVEDLDACWDQIAARAEDHVIEETRRLAVMARRGAVSLRWAVAQEQTRLADLGRRARVEAANSLARRAVGLYRSSGAIRSAVRVQLAQRRSRLDALRRGLEGSRLALWIGRQSQRVDAVRLRLGPLAGRQLGREEAALSSARSRVASLDPQRVLARGFTLTFDETGKLVRHTSQLRPGMTMTTRLHDGEAHSRVESCDAHPRETREEEA